MQETPRDDVRAALDRLERDTAEGLDAVQHEACDRLRSALILAAAVVLSAIAVVLGGWNLRRSWRALREEVTPS